MIYNKEPKRILFIKSKMTQPRYHYQRTLKLSKFFEITWLTNQRVENIDIDLINTQKHKLIFKTGNKTVSNRFKYYIQHIGFYFFCKQHIKKQNYDLIVVHMERFCFVLPLIIHDQNLALQLFTSSVGKSKFFNSFLDFEKLFSTFFFKKIIIGTEWMKKKFRLNKKKTILTRWGTDPISTKPKLFNSLKLLYIGTLTNRNIYETVEGLNIFLKSYKESIEITYDIIGTGENQSIEVINKIITENNLGNIIKLHGYLNDAEIKYYFDNCNIGIAYIPITNYFTNVIATKLDEYLTSGLAVIATNTNENKKQMKNEFGVLVDDNPMAFAKGLHDITRNLNTFNSSIIMKKSANKTLTYNVKHNIVPGYTSLIN